MQTESSSVPGPEPSDPVPFARRQVFFAKERVKHQQRHGLWSILLAGSWLVLIFLALGWQDWQDWRHSRADLALSSAWHGADMLEHELQRLQRQGVLLSRSIPALADDLQRIEGRQEERVQMDALLAQWFMNYASYEFFPVADCDMYFPPAWMLYCIEDSYISHVLTDRPGASLSLLIPLRDSRDERFMLWVRLGFAPIAELLETLSLGGQRGVLLSPEEAAQRTDLLAQVAVSSTRWVLGVEPDADVWWQQRVYIARRVGGAVLLVLLGAMLLAFLRTRALREAQRRFELELSHTQLYEQATHDALTGLFNRYAFNEHFQRLVRQSRRLQKPIAVLLIDIDHFKQVNDLWGHEAGDNLLRKVAEVIGERARRPLDMAARLGGEEFAVLLDGVGAAEAWALGELLRLCVADLRLPHPTRGRVSVSVGVASCGPDHFIPPKDLLEHADRALYAAKAAGRNRVMGDWEA
ncbi:MAG: GGDEF domain-containing protein [Halothiobacillaceae bacterium]